MRILFVDQYSDLGGAQFSLRDIMTGVLERGWHAELLAPGAGALFEFCRSNSIPAHSCRLGKYSNGSKKPLQFLRYGFDIAGAARKLRSIVSQNRIGIVMVNGPRILPAAVGIGVPVVFHLHNLVDKWYTSRIIQASLRLCRARAACCSEFIAEPLLQIADPASVSIVYNGVSDPGFTLKSLGTDELRVGILGRIAPEKGHEDFIAAAKRIAVNHPNVRFQIHGDSLFSDPSCQERARALAVGAPVDFCGWTNNVPAVFRELDILTVPSKGVEATPRVIIEAMAAGTPVVAYRSGGIPELIRHDITGIMTDAPNEIALAEAIVRLISDPQLRLALARNARREWENRFRLERFQQDMCELFEDAVKPRAIESRKTEAAAAITGKHNLL